MWKGKIIEAYDISWLKEIKDKMLDFTHKLEEEMLYHLNNQCLSLNNMEKKGQVKETKLPWNPEE